MRNTKLIRIKYYLMWKKRDSVWIEKWHSPWRLLKHGYIHPCITLHLLYILLTIIGHFLIQISFQINIIYSVRQSTENFGLGNNIAILCTINLDDYANKSILSHHLMNIHLHVYISHNRSVECTHSTSIWFYCNVIIFNRLSNKIL
jgi:hypothetical protein